MRITPAMVLLAITLGAVIACSTQTEVREVEVTREISVVQEVPVTRVVETVKTVEITREVPVVEAVVTVEQIPVTRKVVALQQVEVTREVPVTRVVIVTPAPRSASHPHPEESPTATPTPITTPAPTVAPAPAAESLYGNWQMERVSYGGRDSVSFRNAAVKYETAGNAPVVTYQCDTSGNRAMYIDWHHTLATAESNISRSYRGNPVKQYQDDDLDALIEYTVNLSEFIEDLRLSRSDQIDLDEAWAEVRNHWQLREGMPDELIRRMRDRNHRSVLIDLDFYEERPDPDKKRKYGPPVLATISSKWVVLSNSRSQINAGTIGELKPTLRRIENPQPLADTMQMMTATVKEPAQPAAIIAKWKSNGLRQVMDYCKIIQK